MTYQGGFDAILRYLDAHPDVDVARYAQTVAEALLRGTSSRARRNEPQIVDVAE